MLGLRSTHLERRTVSSTSTTKANSAHMPPDASVDDEKAMPLVTSRTPSINLQMNGKVGSNGVFHSSPTDRQFGSRRASYKFNAAEDIREETLTRVIQTVQQNFIRDVDEINEEFIETTSIHSFVEYLNKERLVTMPHRGSTYDRALKSAEYFALQVTAFGDALQAWVPDSIKGAEIILVGCRALLNMGQECANALDACFALFYQAGRALGHLLRNQRHLKNGSEVANELEKMYRILVLLVADVALHCQMALVSVQSDSVSFNLNKVTAENISAFYQCKAYVTDTMWSQVLTTRGQKLDFSISDIRRWLAPQDSITRSLLSDRLVQRGKRAEYSCEWLQSHLANFFSTSSQTLAITGPSGHGKSVMASWIEDRLQRPLNKRNYETISFFFESDIPSEATSMAVIKRLLDQLIAQNFGDVAFFEELCTAYAESKRSKDALTVENALWKALKVGVHTFATSKTKLVLLIDGIDRLSGSDAVVEALYKRIHGFVAEVAHVRAIVTSQNPLKSPAKHIHHLAITKDHTMTDVRRLIYDNLSSHHHFEKFSPELQENLVTQLCHSAEGNFLWVELVMMMLHTENTAKGFETVVKQSPSNISELLSKLVHDLEQQSSGPDTKHIIGWMTVAERPLTLSEISILLHIDIDRSVVADGHIDVGKKLTKTFGSLISIQNELVRFRHDSVRQCFLNHSANGKFFMPMKDAQREFVLRMLVYSKLCMDVQFEPSSEILDWAVANEAFHRHHFLEYSLRYWVQHFHRSSLYGKNGELDLPSQVKSVFPTSALQVMFEWMCWEPQTSSHEAIERFNLALRIRERLFGDQDSAVLQCLVTLGSIYQSLGNDTETRTFMYRSYLVASKVLTKYSTLVVHCATVFLELTNSLTLSTRTETVTRRETVLKFFITYHKSRLGSNSTVVVEYLRLLATLYEQIKEEEAAALIYEQIHEILIRIHGKDSEEASDMKERMVVLRKGHKQALPEHEGSIFYKGENITVATDYRDLLSQIQVAESYEARGVFYAAEEIYTQIWTRIIELCRTEYSLEIYMAKIDIALAYAKFLRRTKRNAEASSIILCIWVECEKESFTSEEIAIKIKTVGELMKSFGLLSVAMSVFQKVWTFFKATGKHTHEAAISVTELISETAEQIITVSTQTTTTSDTTVTAVSATREETTKSTTLVQELFDTTVSRSHQTESRFALVKSCNALTSMYIREKRYEEAIATIQTCLQVVWKVGITGIGMIALPERNVSEVVTIALDLARCYKSLDRFEKAEEIYVRVYQACLFSLKIEDNHVQTTLAALIAFYEEYHWHDKTIDIYLDLISAYRRQLGLMHVLTIKTIYTGASLMRKYGRKQAYELYSEMIVILSQETHACHTEAFQAAVTLLKWYYEEQRWADLRKLCEVLWHGCRSRKYNFDASNLQLIYEKYVFVLDVHFKTEIKILRQIAIEFKEIAAKVFGESSSIYSEALCALAAVCERHEEYYQEAVTTYEEVIKKVNTTSVATTNTTKTTVTTTWQRSVKERLTKLYVKVISSSSNTSTTTIDRAMILSVESYEQSKAQYGCWHKSTRTALEELIKIHRKAKSKQSHALVTKFLQNTVIEVLVMYKDDSQQLWESAIALAELFVTADLVEKGLEIVNDLRSQVAVNGHSSKQAPKFQFDFGQAIHGRAVYIFIVMFGKRIRGELHGGYDDLLADLMTESVLFEQFNRLRKEKTTKVEVILAHVARLRQFLVSRHRRHELKLVEEQAYEIFLNEYSSDIKTKTAATYVFFVGILEEMSKRSAASFTSEDITNLACISGIEKLKHYLEHGQFQQGYDVAHCTFEFCTARKAFHEHRNVGVGLKLCQYLAGDLVRKNPDSKLLDSMLGLSRKIIDQIFAMFKEAKFSLVRLAAEDLNDLVGLLGDQKNYKDLEDVLSQLWSSRDVQRKWSQDVVITVGNCLVQAYFNNNKGKDKAVPLCEDICYNLRRAHGALDSKTLEMYELLSELYTAQGRFADAMRIHEDLLTVIVEGEDFDENGEDDEAEQAKETGQTTSESAAVKVRHAERQLELLRRDYMRLQGWAKEKHLYVELDRKLRSDVKGIHVEPVEKWDYKKMGPVDDMGMYKNPAKWFIVSEEREEEVKRQQQGSQQVRIKTSSRGLNVGDLAKGGANGKVEH